MIKRIARWGIVLLSAVMIYVGLAFLSDGVTIDLTAEKLTSLSEGTVQTLERLEEDVQIYLVYREETENNLRTMLETVAESFARYPHVSFDVVDPVAEPGRISPFQTSGQTISEGSAIVATTDGSHFETISAREMYSYTVSSSGTYTMTGLQAEKRFTACIRSVTGTDRANVYFLTGHREAGLSDCSALTSTLRAENYNVSEFTFQEGTLQQGDVLVVLSPTVDLMAEEAEALNGFLDAGGRLFFACDATINLDTLPNFAGLAARFSLSFVPGLVVESENRPAYWVSSPMYLMPEVHRDAEGMAAFLADGRVILPGARPIAGPEIPLSGYTYETLLSTSNQAYIKQTDASSFAREETDLTGTQQLAVAVRGISEETGTEMRAVFMGTLYSAVDNSLMNSTSNLDWMTLVINHLAEREDAVSVPVRMLDDTSISIPSAAEGITLFGITLVLPVFTAIAGAIVMIRRRRK